MAEGAGGERRRSVLRWLAGLGVALLLIVTTASAFIRLSNAGLGCADWPQCYGQVTAGGAAARDGAKDPAAVSPAIIAARLLHRVAALAALVLVLTIALTCFARPVWWREGWTAVALIGLTIFLAVLGRWTAGSRLPAVVLGNLTGGFAMLALLWSLRLSSEDVGHGPDSANLLPWVQLSLLVVALQILLGGLISAGFTATACPTLPDCHGVWWPIPTPWRAFSPWHAPLAGSAEAMALHMAHRFGAAIVLGVAGGLAAAAWRVGRRQRAAAAVVLALLSAQLALGVLSVVGELPLAAVVAHNLTAALLLLALISLGSRLRRA